MGSDPDLAPPKPQHPHTTGVHDRVQTPFMQRTPVFHARRASTPARVPHPEGPAACTPARPASPPATSHASTLAHTPTRPHARPHAPRPAPPHPNPHTGPGPKS